VQFEARLEMRYRGQGFEISVRHGARALEEFHREHQRMYGYSRVGSPVEIVTVRLRPGSRLRHRRLLRLPTHSLRERMGHPTETASVTFGGKAQMAKSWTGAV